MKYGLRRPCKACPFRNDIEPYLRYGRAEEIGDSIRGGAPFPCHETITHEEAYDDDGAEYQSAVYTEDTQHCAGAMLVLLKEEGNAGSMLLHLAQRAGLYDPARMDLSAPVYDDVDEWIAAHEEVEGSEYE